MCHRVLFKDIQIKYGNVDSDIHNKKNESDLYIYYHSFKGRDIILSIVSRQVR